MMENKINIAEIIKNCPSGMELDCPMYDNLYFDLVNDYYNDTINCYTLIDGIKTSVTFTKYGTYNNFAGAKCVIFPKGKTNWEGFKIPFKDGDVVFYGDTIAIFKEWGDETLFRTYVAKYLCCDSLIDMNVPLFGKSVRKEIRLATKEEKQKLFQAIKDNGYKWNPRTKTLEKLIIPRFKVDDKIKDKIHGKRICTVTLVTPECYVIREVGYPYSYQLSISNQDDWELVADPKFKVGNKIRYKGDKTNITITGIKDDYYFIQFYNIRKNDYQNEKVSFKDQDKYELVPNKFDISIFKPFDKVLVRTDNSYWRIQFFERINKNNKNYPFVCMSGNNYNQCIPYEGNEHLLNTNSDCDNYYKTWE